MSAEQIEHRDGRVELADGVVLSDDRLYNEDLAPTRVANRTWSTYTFAALWISMAHCIPTYMLASSLISSGMSWWQALLTILLGNVIVLAPILLNSHAGTKYGIPFPVFARASYGVYGANVPAVMRALVACGWFGINCWIGGEALNAFFKSLWPAWEALLGGKVQGYFPTQWLCFLLFWGLNILIIYRGMELIRKLENLAAPYVLVMTAILLVWAISKAGGVGELLTAPGKFRDFSSFWPVFVPSVTAMIGFWATLSLNMPDFTRFGRSQKEQAVGQVVALPTTMVLFSAMGILITSSAREIYKDKLAPEELEELWKPIKLVEQFHDDRVVVAVATFTIVIATLAVNIAANVVSPANDFSNIAPKKISFKTGGLITGIIGILVMPWKLVENETVYIYGWLVGYSAGLGSIAGVLIVDYWVLRKKQLNVPDLYRRPSGNRSYVGTSWQAIGATAIGCGLAWSGAVIAELKPLFDYGWFVGTFASGFAYWLMMRGRMKLGDAAEA